MKIFVSVGTTYNDKQEAFVKAFENFLSQNRCERLTVGRGSYFAKQPLAAARDLMEEADGVVVIAFTRQILESAVEKPGSDQAHHLTNRNYTTIWNQIEAAMAFGLKLPILMIAEDSIYQEAMVKDRYEYRVFLTKLDPNFFSSDEFKGTFSDWKRSAELQSREKTDTSLKDGLTVGGIIKEMRPDQFWKFGGALFTVGAAIAAAAFWVGNNIPTQ